MKKGIIFDFDYTLGDATEGIALSVNYALEQLGYGARNIEEIKKTIGLSLKDTYMALTGQTNSDEAERFSAFFREKADEVMVAHTALYEGTVDALRKLKENGFQVGIVTTKFHYRIDQILDKFHVADLVDFIVGAEDVQEEKPNPEGLLSMLSQMHLDKEQALYVGDSTVDAQTAERGNVDFAGVLTGTTTRQDFEKYSHVFIGANIGEIYSHLMRDIVDRLLYYMETRNRKLLITSDMEMEPSNLAVITIEILAWLKLEHKRTMWMAEGKKTCLKPFKLKQCPWCLDLCRLVEKEREFQLYFNIENGYFNFSDNVTEVERKILRKKAFQNFNPQINT